MRLVKLEFYFHEFDAYIANWSRKNSNQFYTINSKKPKTIRRDHVFSRYKLAVCNKNIAEIFQHKFFPIFLSIPMLTPIPLLLSLFHVLFLYNFNLCLGLCFRFYTVKSDWYSCIWYYSLAAYWWLHYYKPTAKHFYLTPIRFAFYYRTIILFDEIEEFCLDRENPSLGMESRMLTTAMLTQVSTLSCSYTLSLSFF